MITKEIAESLHHGQTLYHKTEKNKTGTPFRCRVNGKCKTWKTRPQEFRLPVKWGLKRCFYITNGNAHEWLLENPTVVKDSKPANGFEEKLVENPMDWELRLIYADWLEENGQEILACGQRYQAEWKIRPKDNVGIGTRAFWYEVLCKSGQTYHNGPDPESNITKRVFDLLICGERNQWMGERIEPALWPDMEISGEVRIVRYCRSYKSRQEAEADLAQAVWSLKYAKV